MFPPEVLFFPPLRPTSGEDPDSGRQHVLTKKQPATLKPDAFFCPLAEGPFDPLLARTRASLVTGPYLSEPSPPQTPTLPFSVPRNPNADSKTYLRHNAEMRALEPVFRHAAPSLLCPPRSASFAIPPPSPAPPTPPPHLPLPPLHPPPFVSAPVATPTRPLSYTPPTENIRSRPRPPPPETQTQTDP